MNDVSSKKYYDSDDGFNFYSIINTVDYSGIGIYPEMVDEEDTLTEETYKRGSGVSVRDATLKRNLKMLRFIK